MSTHKIGNEKSPVAVAPTRPRDGPEVADLVDALDALAVSEAATPTLRETRDLRADVVTAGAALERKQHRGSSG